MPERLSLTLIALSTVTVALCVLLSTVILYNVGRRLHKLSERVERLTEQLKASAVPAAADLRATIHSLSQLAALGSRFARPLLASTVLRTSPGWVRSLGVLAGVYAAAQQFIPDLRPDALLKRVARSGSSTKKAESADS